MAGYTLHRSQSERIRIMTKRKKIEQTPDELAQQMETQDDLSMRLQSIETRLTALEAIQAQMEATAKSNMPILCGTCGRECLPNEILHHINGTTQARCQQCMKCFSCGRPLVDASNHLRTDAIPVTPNSDGMPLCRDCAIRLGYLA